MTSKLVVNTIEADTGISSVSFASSISMSSTSKFHFSAAGIDIDADTNINRPAAGVLGFNINSSEKMRLDSSGRLLIGTTTEGNESADELTINSSGNTGVTVRSGTSSNGSLFFSDTTSGAAEYVGFVQYQHASNVMIFGTSSTERLRITSDGSIGINATTPSAGDLATGDSQNTPVLHVNGSGASDTTGEYNLIARFEGGGDADSTGAMIVINHGNDRGLAIQGGRRTGNYAHGALKMIDNVGRLSDAIFIHGGAGQGVNHMGFYTGESTTTTERLRITSGGNFTIGNTHGAKKIHISHAGNQKILIDPNYNNNSGGSSNSEANANNVVDSILIRTSFGDNAASQTNAGHKWGIKFQGYNGNDFTQNISKVAAVYAVSEDGAGGYNRNVGLAFHTSPYNTNHREVMRINTNGIVTKPYQYMFTVSTTNHSKSANWSQITNHAPVAAQCTNVSDGNNWSNSTQRFTAPVAGVYHFFVGGWSYGNSNGSRYAYCFKHTNGNNYTFIGGGDYCSGDSPMAGWSRDIKLSAGEWVELWGYSAISVQWGGGHHFFWGGYLLG